MKEHKKNDFSLNRRPYAYGYMFLSYERAIGLGLLNFNRMVYCKEGITRLVLFQR